MLEDTDVLYTGTREIDQTFWERNSKDIKSWQDHGRSYYQLSGSDCANLYVNQLLWQEGEKPFQRG